MKIWPVARKSLRTVEIAHGEVLKSKNRASEINENSSKVATPDRTGPMPTEFRAKTVRSGPLQSAQSDLSVLKDTRAAQILENFDR